MSDIDEEIMQDFLIEAGELYDLLNDQLTELKSNADNDELLNAIFRAFHTIKGGAGFMKLNPMVEVCHRAEDVFDLLRNGSIKSDDGLVDVMFQVLDVLGDMFESIREGDEQESASPDLLQQLDSYRVVQKTTTAAPENLPEQTAQKTASLNESADTATQAANASMDDEFEQMQQTAKQAQAEVNVPSNDLITDDEFENLLDDIHGKGKHKIQSGNNPAPVTQTADDGLITDDEFEKLLDNIHGEGKHKTATQSTVESPATIVDEGIITDDEFDAVLDQMHGKNKGPGTGTEAKTEKVATASDETPPAAENVEPEKKKAAKKPPVQKDTSVRVDTERLDDIMNLVGELVLVKNRLSVLKQTVQHEKIEEAITTLELVTSDLQTSVLKTRMQPIKKVFNRFPRVIRDLARKLNKDINLELVGENTDLDKSLVEALVDPLIHLVRNSADHGIESPNDRFAAGKSRQGTVTLSAQQEGDQILLTVSDDGKGMDHLAFRKKAVESGMMNESAAKNLSNKEAFNLIFAPGFSTKSEISDVSGRGVGMDVVKTRINELNGSIDIDSKLGEGSVITIYLPLTLAILPTLMVMLNEHQFALPLNNVYETFNMTLDNINVVDGQEVIRVRDQTLPLFFLSPWLVRNQNFDGPKIDHKVLVIQMGGIRFCLVVDQILGQEEVVIKPLGKLLSVAPGFSGATITGDGSIALVLDMPSLMGAYASNYMVH